MVRERIPVEQFMLKPIQAWNDWFLLAAGDFTAQRYNAMTVAWGSMGVMWGRPFVQVVVRPTRYTFEFMEKYDNFTVCAFPEAQRDALSLLGSKSGRDSDKMTESGLTPIASSTVSAPGFDEAELIIECTKIYSQQLDPARFNAPYISKLYNNDYHWAYFGEIVAVSATKVYGC